MLYVDINFVFVCFFQEVGLLCIVREIEEGLVWSHYTTESHG